MDKAIFEKNLERLEFQKNLALVAILCLAALSLLLGVFVFFKRERVVLVPPKIEKLMWVDNSSVSPSYLEQISIFISNLLLNKTAATAPKVREQLLSLASPKFYPVLRSRLLEEERKAKKENLSYSFFFDKVEVDAQGLKTAVEGRVLLRAGNRGVVDEKSRIELNFSLASGKLELVALTESKI